MTGRAIDISGQKFGHLIAVSRTPDSNQFWICICSCGGERIVKTNSLRRGKVVSCGCKYRDYSHRQKHGMKGTSEYTTWLCMKGRCFYSKNEKFKYYGGRGITVCDRWKNDFAAFYADMGPKPSPEHSIDRIAVNGDYEPNNCRWATKSEQETNKRPRAIYATRVPV